MNKRLENFARLAVEFGVNVQKGEDLIINSPIESPELARAMAKAAYDRGARLVSIDFRDDYLTRLAYTYQDQETLNEVANWKIEKLKYQIEEKRSNRISISAQDPDLLDGLDQEKIAQAIRENSKMTKDFVKYSMNDIISWLVISVPTKKWAKKVFSELTEDQAYDKLWELILDVSRIDESWDITKKNWQDHLEGLDNKANYLNSHQFEKIVYKSSNGTDLSVGLPKNHIWMSAGSTNEKGDKFVPNIPTEEVFTSPLYNKVDGKLVATKPLVYNGVVIDDFYFIFEDGKVVDFDAKYGKDALEKMLDSDEGSRYLGEVALVPYDSPISNSNVLFYNTLFDENASCHFALGKAYPTTVEGGVDVDDDKLRDIGINDSLIHEDFMVGSSDLEITGIKEGREYKIFENGNWAI